MDESEKRDLQLQREKCTVTRAVTILREQIERSPADTAVGRAFLRTEWAKFVTIVANEQARLRGVQRPRYATLMLGLNANHLAFITVRCILASLYGTKAEKEGEKQPELDKFTALSAKIGLHCRLEWMRTLEPETERAIYDFGGEGKNDGTAAKARERAGKILRGDWRDCDGHIHLGSELLKLAEMAKLVSMRRKKDKNGKPSGVIPVLPSDRVRRALEWQDEFTKVAMPFYLPMICLPKPWVGLEGGGYLTNESERTIHLVKHWDNPKFVAGLAKGDYVVTRDAVNALQDTPWRVNSKIYKVMRQAEAMGKRAVRKEMRNLLSLKLSICADLEKTEERFYFPYQLDFRGRAYCLPPLVNPQSDDIGRSLLEFADGKPLGDGGVRWLQIHLANSFAECKGTLNERVNWVLKNSKKIRESAADPFGRRWWMKADKAWRFLAACFEWDAYLSDTAGFLSFLPITVDGSCNGFQHFSALLLNTKGATATNLMPGNRPHDFYQEVADLLRRNLDEDAQEGVAEAKDWLDNVKNIGRKLVKPTVMATPYGIGRAKIKDQLMEEKFSKKLRTPEASCNYLARSLQWCIKKEFPEAHATSKWFQTVARIFALVPQGIAARGVHWDTPSGFRVVHERWLGKTRRLTGC